LPEISSPRKTRWFHWAVLICLISIGASMRYYRVSRESLSFDEYWALYLSTARGSQLFEIPHGVIVEAPPQVDFQGAPAWWHIWSRLGTVTHPPLYYISLRWCVDLFGSSDRSIRMMSVLLGLAAVIVLFDAVRRSAGPWAALIAAALMIFSTAQIDIGQMTRPYTMLVFFGVVLCDALIAVDRSGISKLKLTIIAVATAAMALTHYFSAGAILAVDGDYRQL
jgi:4-amino-4-deoxy-L-arabinose transferase-like glycosyltransferase